MFRRFTNHAFCILARSLLSMLVMGSVMVPHNAVADQKGAAEIQAAEEAYKKALKDWEDIQHQQRKATAERQSATDAFQKQWAEVWLKRREATDAFRQAKIARDAELNALRQRINNLGLDHNTAKRRVDAARDALIFTLENLSDVEKGRNKALSADVLRADADEKRAAMQAANEAHAALQAQLIEAQDQLQERTGALETQISDIRATIPDKAEVIGLEQAYSARLDGLTKLPIRDELLLRQSEEQDAANRLLSAMLKNPPIYVNGVTVNYDGAPWYHARVVENSTGKGPANDAVGAQAYRRAAEQVTTELVSLNTLLAKTERTLKRTRDNWEYNSQAQSWHEHLIELRKRDMAIFTLVVESSAVALSAVVSGGTAAPVVYGFFESLTKAAKLGVKGLDQDALEMLHKGALSGFNTTALIDLAGAAKNTTFGKFWSELILTGRSGVVDLYSGHQTSEVGNNFDLSDLQSVAVGDVVETLLVDGAGDVAGVVSDSLRAGKLSLGNAGPLGIAVGATTTKLLAQAWVDLLNDDSKLAAYQAGIEAMMAQRTHMRVVRVRNLLRVEQKRLEALRDALDQLIASGQMPRKIDVTHDESIVVSKAEKTDLWEIHVSFSQPLEYPPTLSGNSSGVTFSNATKSENGPTEWLFEVVSFDPDLEAHAIPFLIELSSNETPYAYLDGDPRTPTRLASLNWQELHDYESGADRNHEIRMRNHRIDVVVADIFNLNPAACWGLVKVEVGRGWLKDAKTYYDSDRQKMLEPFEAGETLVVCEAPNKAGVQRDEFGRIVVYMAAAGSEMATGPYANGYRTPMEEQFGALFSQGKSLEFEKLNAPIINTPVFEIPKLKPSKNLDQ